MPRRDLEDLARLLADKAAGDEGVLEKLSRDRDIPDEVLGFHAQQAVEKLIKAVLAARGIQPPRSHDVGYLLGLLEENGIQPPPDASAVEGLTPWAAEFRYAESYGQSLDRVAALTLVRGARSWARTQLPG